MPSLGFLALTAGVWQINFSVQYQVEPSTITNSLWLRVFVGGQKVHQVDTTIPIVTQTTTGTVTGTITVTSTTTTSQNVELAARTANLSTNITIPASSVSNKTSYLQITQVGFV